MERSLALVRGEVSAKSNSSKQVMDLNAADEPIETIQASYEKEEQAILNPQDQAFVEKATRLVLDNFERHRLHHRPPLPGDGDEPYALLWQVEDTDRARTARFHATHPFGTGCDVLETGRQRVGCLSESRFRECEVL